MWETRLRLRGAAHPNTLWACETLADFLANHGKVAEAESHYRQLLEAARNVSPANPAGVADRLATLAGHLTNAGRPAEAEPLARECVSTREQHLAKGHWRTASARGILGECLARQKKFEAAEPALLASYEELTKAANAPPARIADAVRRTAELYEQWGKQAEAETWRKKQKDAKGAAK